MIWLMVLDLRLVKRMSVSRLTDPTLDWTPDRARQETAPVTSDSVHQRIGRSQCASDPSVCPARLVRRNALVEQNDPVRPRRCEHSLFSVMGQKLTGRATALIIAAAEADAEYYALHDLGFVTVAVTTLVSESVYWNRD